MAKQDEDNGGEKWVRRPFPKHSLEQTLIIPSAIQDKNAGKPMRRLLLADAIGRKPTSSEFKYLLSSSFKYGLTDGTEKSEQIILTPLGQAIVQPRSVEERMAKLQDAALKPDLFKRVFDYYNNAKFPTDGKFFRNVLERDFGVHTDWVDDCVKILNDNGKFSGIVRNVSGSPFVILGDLSEVPAAEVSTEQTSIESPTTVTGGDTSMRTTPPPVIVPRVFISHSKNAKVVEQLKRMLVFGGFQSEVAEEHQTTSIPVPQKVFESMRRCNCAVINVSADEQEKRDDGSYGINPNVLIEIGGAFLLYDKKVILLVDKKIKLPSNLQGLYVLPYDGDELSWDMGMKMQEALTGFKSKL